MGALTSRQNAGVEEVDIVSNHAYKYPPKSGNYFGSHFIMGGERFDTPQPEAYLFGENADLNFLGSRPTPFPYPPPQANEPTKTLKSLVNIRKESMRLVRALGTGKGDDDNIKPTNFNIEFTFDCDARTAITIYYFASEEFTPNGVVYCPRDPSLTSETYYYKRGTNQLFSQPNHVFDPSRYTGEELAYNPDKEIIPVAIHCVAYEGPEVRMADSLADDQIAHLIWNENEDDDPNNLDENRPPEVMEEQIEENDEQPPDEDVIDHQPVESGEGEVQLEPTVYGHSGYGWSCTAPSRRDQKQSHTSIAVIERHSDGTYVMKALKQRLYVDGLCYLLQEIYGIENKGNDSVKGNSDDEAEDNGSECVICMCDIRDTLILPCRHLCLCNSCADSLRYQANNCPICRAPFRALLQIRALQKATSQLPTIPQEGNCENIPAGYEAISLIEALNGPSINRGMAPALVVALEPLDQEDSTVAVQAAEVLNRSCIERIPTTVKLPPEGENTPEVQMSVLRAREGEGGKEKTKSPLRKRDKAAARPRDTVRVVNEMVPNQDETQDEDSEAEKMSPLLERAACTDSPPPPVITQEEGEEEEQLKVEIPQNSRVADDRPCVVGCESGLAVVAAGAGDDSDYYTPEDPATTILSPLHSDKERGCERTGGVEGVGRWLARESLSLPGTPLSTASHRSSGDSYSSSSSTRLLLSTNDKTTLA